MPGNRQFLNDLDASISVLNFTFEDASSILNQHRTYRDEKEKQQEGGLICIFGTFCEWWNKLMLYIPGRKKSVGGSIWKWITYI